MDPIANLQEQREIVARIVNGYGVTDPNFEADACRLAVLVEALDEWRLRGGFDPYGWPPGPIEAPAWGE